MLWRSGLRVVEALALELRDVDLTAGTLRVRHGKGDRSAPWALAPRCWPGGSIVAASCTPALERPCCARLPAGASTPPTSGVCFPASRSRAGIEGKRVHAHGLRRTHAAELAREGVAVNVIRDALGHSTLAVTDRYLRDVAPQHVIDTQRARSWPGPRVTPHTDPARSKPV